MGRLTLPSLKARGFFVLRANLLKGESNAFVLMLLISIGAGVAVWFLVLLLANFKSVLAKFKRER